MIIGRMPNLVKGRGYAFPGGNTPENDPEKILDMSLRAEKSLRKAVDTSLKNPDAVRKGLNPSFTSQYGAFMANQPGANAVAELAAEVGRVLSAELQRNITVGSPLSSGFVPFDLVAPARLIYPVYSPLRNKIPRVPGQGTSRRTKIMTGISGSSTGGQANIRISIPELVQTGGTLAANNWPLNLPPSGSQTAYDLNIPYQFFGLTESLSWLAQFAGQGFEDISALANLVLLQEFMLGEELEIIAGTGHAIPAPSSVSLAAVAATSGQTAVSGAGTYTFVGVTNVNFWGETAMTVSAGVALTNGTDVGAVTIGQSGSSLGHNIYVAQNTTTTAPASTAFYKVASGVGGSNYTLMGALPASGTNPPTADTGTSSSTDYEGMDSVLSGWAATNNVYPSGAGFQGGYVNLSVGDILSTNAVENALQALWDGAGAFRADPAELIAEGGDIRRLSDSIVNQPNNNAYRFFIQQNEISNITAGQAVAEFQNPITRSLIKLLVHPWLPQGKAYLMSYTLPFSWSNVSNVVENVMNQDYLSISWPTIDASWRFSMFMYGALVFNAPQYCGVLGGLQRTTPTATTATPYFS